jgi:phosphoribosylaminoimidazole carboxylase PurE protein
VSAQVAIVMGSSSDATIMAVAEETLTGLGIEHETRVLSAHRTPDEVRDWARGLAGRGVTVVSAAAGGAAHLAGAVAAHQILPVIGVPLASPNAVAGGLDALLSTVQMPRGVPVATVAIGEAGAANAAILAAEILALNDDALRGRIHTMRQSMAARILSP